VAITLRPEGITNPPIDDLLDTAGSKYQLVIYAAKRARQINAYYSQLGEGLLEYVGPLVETQLQEKPLSIALREINSKLLKTEHVDPEVLAQEAVEIEQRRLAAIQAQQRYNSGYDNSFAGVYEETFEETQEVVTEDVETPIAAEVVVDNEEDNDTAPTEETPS
jgi:DNA-directed RNA polymerase subunit omega